MINRLGGLVALLGMLPACKKPEPVQSTATSATSPDSMADRSVQVQPDCNVRYAGVALNAAIRFAADVAVYRQSLLCK